MGRLGERISPGLFYHFFAVRDAATSENTELPVGRSRLPIFTGSVDRVLTKLDISL